jgi:hypothetical protein
MHTPEFVGLGEMMAMFNVGRTRIAVIITREDFPKPYLYLHIGRIWRLADIVNWAQDVGRRITLPIPEPGETVTVSPSAVAVSARPPNSNTSAIPVTISSGEEQKQVEVAEKTQPPRLASLASSPVVADSPDLAPDVAEIPTRRSTIELNRIALAEDWDDLERIYKAAKKNEGLPESDLKLVGFASMVIASEANVPNYRRTKDIMIRAWGEVRRAYTPTAEELALLAEHVVASAQTPFTPGAVKKFSDFEIAKIRRTAVAQNARPQQGWSRWQGAHGSADDEIANLTPEQRARYGVKESK